MTSIHIGNVWASLLVVATTLSISACGTDHRCMEMEAKLQSCDPQMTSLTCSSRMMDQYDQVMNMECGVGVRAAKADGASSNLFDIRRAALKEKGYLNLADLETMFRAVGLYYSPVEANFMITLLLDIRGYEVDYQHTPLKDEMAIAGIFSDGRFTVPQRYTNAARDDNGLGAETVDRFIRLCTPSGPRW